MATSSGAATGGGMSSSELQIGWQYRAACKGPQSHLFFAPNHLERKEERLAREAAAKAICRRCPVLAECREYALLVREPYGIWGGLNEYEPRQLLARRARRARHDHLGVRHRPPAAAQPQAAPGQLGRGRLGAGGGPHRRGGWHR